MLKYLSVRNRYYNRFVCKRWNLILQTLLNDVWIIIHKDINLPRVPLRHNIALYDAEIDIYRLLPYAKRVKSLKIACAINWESLIDFFNDLEEIEYLDFTSCCASFFPNISLEKLKTLKVGSQCSFDLGKVLAKSPVLRHVTFHQSHFNSLVEKFIRNSKSLEEVYFERILEENEQLVNFFETGINHLKVFKQSGTISNVFLPHSNEVIEKLIICGTGISGSLSFTPLFKLASQLKSLKLATPGVSINWNILKKVYNLEELLVSNNRGELDDGLAHLKLLKCLDIASCSSVTSKTMDLLTSNCPLLEHINISGISNIKNEDVRNLIKITKNLKTLFLDHCFSLTYQCLLDIHVYAPKISALSLQKLKQDETALEDVAKLKNLEYLNVAFCKLSDLWFKSTCFKLLMAIKLSHTFITDEGVQHLARNSSRIREMNLMATEITDSCLKNLVKINTLRVLDVTSCQNVSNEITNELQDKYRLCHFFSSLPTPYALDCPCISLYQKLNVPFYKMFAII